MARATGRRKTAELSALAPILVIVGMKREAACAAGEGVTTLCSGANVAAPAASARCAWRN